MIEQGFDYVDSTINQIIDIYETRVENLKLMEDKEKLPLAPIKKQGKEVQKEMEN